MKLTPEQEQAVQAVIVCGGPLPSRETYAKARALRDRFAAENANPAPPLSDARVERVAREIWSTFGAGAQLGWTWNLLCNTYPVIAEQYRENVRAVLAAADAVPPAKTGEEEGR